MKFMLYPVLIFLALCYAFALLLVIRLAIGRRPIWTRRRYWLRSWLRFGRKHGRTNHLRQDMPPETAATAATIETT